MSIQLIKSALQDPWKIRKGLYYEAEGMSRYGEHEDKYKRNTTNKPYAIRHLRDGDEGSTDLKEAQLDGKNAWGGTEELRHNMLLPEDTEKREELVETLEKFQKETGIDEKKQIEKLMKCKSRRDIDVLESKFKKASTSWYKKELIKSGAFDPVVDGDGPGLKREIDELTDWFSTLKFHEKDGQQIDMVKTIKELPKNLKPKMEFRTKLQKQSSLVKDEFARRRGSLALIGSRDKLLEEILKEMKEVEDSPSAVQFEFKKVQSGTDATKDTATLKKKILNEYNTRFNKYMGPIMANKQYFGGEEINTKWGEMPETAAEFLEWLEDRKNFAEMDDATKKLPALIKEREHLCKERDEILRYALPEDAKKIIASTKKMRRHELEGYLPELRQYIQNKNVKVVEYVGIIKTARAKSVMLFPDMECAREISKMRLADLDTQNAKLIVLKEEVKDRKEVVNSYFALPAHLRNDQEFLSANAFERESLLKKARERLAHEQTNPLDFEDVDELDTKEINTATKKLKSSEGEKYLDKMIKEIKEEGRLAATEIQRETYKRIFGTQQHAKENKMTQKENYLDDFKKWIYLDRNVKSINDIKTDRQYSKFCQVEKASEAYDKQQVFTSGGEIRNLEVITKNDLEHGYNKEENLRKVSYDRAKYSEHIMIQDEMDQERDAIDPLSMIEKLSKKDLIKLRKLVTQKIGEKTMHLSKRNLNILMNSPDINKAIVNKMMEREFSHLKMDAANNNDSFINQAAA